LKAFFSSCFSSGTFRGPFDCLPGIRVLFGYRVFHAKQHNVGFGPFRISFFLPVLPHLLVRPRIGQLLETFLRFLSGVGYSSTSLAPFACVSKGFMTPLGPQSLHFCGIQYIFEFTFRTLVFRVNLDRFSNSATSVCFYKPGSIPASPFRFPSGPTSPSFNLPPTSLLKGAATSRSPCPPKNCAVTHDKLRSK